MEHVIPKTSVKIKKELLQALVLKAMEFVVSVSLKTYTT